MKRKSRNPIEYSGRIYPILFWHKCCLCGEDFRRERGHWALIYHRTLHLCNDCGGDTIESGIKGFLLWDKRRREDRPSPPGPPPKPIPAGVRYIKEGSQYPK